MNRGKEEQRRYPRLPLTCSVELRDRFMVWDARTANVGLRGCQVLTQRMPKVGELLRLSITAERVRTPLEVLGQVAWTESGASPRAGVSYIGPTPRVVTASPARWFERLLEAEIEAATHRGGSLAALEVKVLLGTPPRSGSLTEQEREIASGVVKGALLSQLLTTPASASVVSSLLRRRILTLMAAAAAAPGRWEDLLAQGIPARDDRFSRGHAKAPAPGFEGMIAQVEPTLPPAARKLLGDFVDAFIAGDTTSAVRLLKRALDCAPGDPMVASMLERIERRRAVTRAAP